MKKLYEAIAQTASALKNCEKSGNVDGWLQRHESKLDRIAQDYLPSGSGIDCGTKINLRHTNDRQIILTGNYHVLNDVGYYTHWIDYTVYVLPSLIGHIDITIAGDFFNEEGEEDENLKDYLYDIYHECLTSEYKED